MPVYIGYLDELPRINYGYRISDPPVRIEAPMVRELIAQQGARSVITMRHAKCAAELKRVHGIELEVSPQLITALQPGDVLIAIHEALLPTRITGADGKEAMDTFIFHRRTVSDSQRRY